MRASTVVGFSSVGLALALLHERPDAPWTLERLAKDAAISRSALHDRRIHFIVQPPRQYLTQWRMQLAAGLLRDTNAKVVEVAGPDTDLARRRSPRRSEPENRSHALAFRQPAGTSTCPGPESPMAKSSR